MNNGYYNDYDHDFYDGDDHSLDSALARRDRFRYEIKKISGFCGLAVIGYIIIQNITVWLMSLTGVMDYYLSNPVFQNGIDIVIAGVALAVPFLLLSEPMAKMSGCFEPLPFKKPCDGKLTLYAVFAGFALCIVASIITSYFVTFVSFFGVTLTSPEIKTQPDTLGTVVSIFRVAVFAPIFEELVFRGYVLQNLRKYGDAFAIVMSSVVFAIIHGNLIQAPFAMIAGITLGYFTVKTKSLYTGIIIHSLNNLFSLIISELLTYSADEQTANLIYSRAVFVILAVGAVCLWLFVQRLKATRRTGLYTERILTAGEKASAFFLSPSMIISIVIMLFFTAQFVEM